MLNQCSDILDSARVHDLSKEILLYVVFYSHQPFGRVRRSAMTSWVT